MRNRLIAAVTLGLALATGAPAQQTDEATPPAEGGEAMAGQDAGAAPAPSGMMQAQRGMGMMRGMTMGHGMMGGRDHRGMPPGMRLMMFVMLDTDGDEALSLEEVLAVHERMFRHVDADDDGTLTMKEIEGFMEKMSR